MARLRRATAPMAHRCLLPRASVATSTHLRLPGLAHARVLWYDSPPRRKSTPVDRVDEADEITTLRLGEENLFWRIPSGRRRVRLVVRSLRDGSRLSLPAITLSDGQTHPCMALVAGQHGNEWNGPWILHRLAREIDPREVRGTLVILPLSNPLAFNEGRRVSSVDHIDLNRTFGGTHARKPTEHLGVSLWKAIFEHVEFLIDLHSGGPGEYFPFVAAPGGRDLALARSLNLPFIHTPEGTKPRFLVSSCQQAGIHAVLVEFGGGRSLDRQYHERVKDGLKNALRFAGVLSGEVEQGSEPYIFQQKQIVPAPVAGFFESAVQLGQHIRTGDIIGSVTPLLAERSIDVPSPHDGTVLYLRREPAVAGQESLAHIAV